MYEVSVREHFDAAHYLREYRGKCERLHGHRYEVVVTVQVPELDSSGLAFDFAELKRHVREVLGQFDHSCLNEVPPFDGINPTAENIAVTVCRGLSDRISAATISQVQVWESPDTWVTYKP
ncbi:MAG: 6-carboxytetrahydropterin synthase QueD [Chloroflexota bacterium]|nr:6-carboxytetrahydropterin synthase QueD [Chloroflexota bacterium]